MRAAIPGFAHISTTVVAGPEFLNKIVRAIGDGLGYKISNTRRTLWEIASGEKQADAIDRLVAGVPEDEKSKGLLSDDIRAAALVQEFIQKVVAAEARRRGQETPALWFRILTVGKEPIPSWILSDTK